MPKKKKNALVMPVLKWVGGKRQLIQDIKDNLPKKYNKYYEPFFGGGAVLFELQPKEAVINDLNSDLILTYKCIKDDVNSLITDLENHVNESEYFYNLRNMDLDSEKFQKMEEYERASRIIYLNKTCFNGLFRVNSSGHFNTPFGDYKNPNIINKPVLLAVSSYFNDNNITILNGDFEAACATAQKGDFVYFDPPYDPVSDTASFTGYNAGGFDKTQQVRLKALCDELNERGVYFLLSNSNTNYIRELYNDYTITIVKAKRNINSKGNKRGEVEEVLVKNY